MLLITQEDVIVRSIKALHQGPGSKVIDHSNAARKLSSVAQQQPHELQGDRIRLLRVVLHAHCYVGDLIALLIQCRRVFHHHCLCRRFWHVALLLTAACLPCRWLPSALLPHYCYCMAHGALYRLRSKRVHQHDVAPCALYMTIHRYLRDCVA